MRDNNELVSNNKAFDNKSYEAPEDSFDNAPDLICLSHLRWDFVFQRPQHLLTRCARERRVFFIEEPTFAPGQDAHLDVSLRDSGVCVVIPRLPEGLSEEEIQAAQKVLLDDLFAKCKVRDYLLWYYTPMALAFTRHLTPLGVIYDCMDELSAFKGAPTSLRERELDLLKRADVVFTGGQSLYEAK
ncbi:MAG TPA: UDP-galactopyranose mutase, partial [Blastocatellia bacterium]|nr:UDP-galactopyranose mutase [Blastocatellia bacterium]